MAQFSNSVIANLTDNYKVSCFWVRMMASAHSKCSALHRLWSSTCWFGIPRKVVGFCTSKRLVYSETRGFVSSCLTLITLHGSKSHYWIVVVTRWASTVIIHIVRLLCWDSDRLHLLLTQMSECNGCWLVTPLDLSWFAQVNSTSAGNVCSVTGKMKRMGPACCLWH